MVLCGRRRQLVGSFPRERSLFHSESRAKCTTFCVLMGTRGRTNTAEFIGEKLASKTTENLKK